MKDLETEKVSGTEQSDLKRLQFFGGKVEVNGSRSWRMVG